MNTLQPPHPLDSVLAITVDEAPQLQPLIELAQAVGTVPPVLAAEAQPQVQAAASDLFLLAGAGPALVWMLQKCGITSLADLAQADAAQLVARLGLVGQIVDVAGWQRFARRQVGGGARSVTG